MELQARGFVGLEMVRVGLQQRDAVVMAFHPVSIVLSCYSFAAFTAHKHRQSFLTFIGVEFGVDIRPPLECR